MINRARQLWKQLSRKDQRAITWMVVILGPIIFVYLVFVPISSFKQRLNDDLKTKQELNQWLMSVGPEATLIARASGKVDRVTESSDISSRVISVANKYQLELQKFEADDGSGLRIWFQSIRYDRFISFLSELSTEQSIFPVNLIIDGEQQGLVSVRGALSPQ